MGDTQIRFISINGDIDTVCKEIRESKGTRLNKLTLKSLLFSAETSNGVYIFKNEKNEVAYVGKCSSRSFIERIPHHFDSREKAYMNVMAKRYQALLARNSSLYECAERIIDTYSLIIIQLAGKENISKMETDLKRELQPLFQKK